MAEVAVVELAKREELEQQLQVVKVATVIVGHLLTALMLVAAAVHSIQLLEHRAQAA
jgi:hypothetical protein